MYLKEEDVQFGVKRFVGHFVFERAEGEGLKGWLGRTVLVLAKPPGSSLLLHRYSVLSIRSQHQLFSNYALSQSPKKKKFSRKRAPAVLPCSCINGGSLALRRHRPDDGEESLRKGQLLSRLSGWCWRYRL